MDAYHDKNRQRWQEMEQVVDNTGSVTRLATLSTKKIMYWGCDPQAWPFDNNTDNVRAVMLTGVGGGKEVQSWPVLRFVPCL